MKPPFEVLRRFRPSDERPQGSTTRTKQAAVGKLAGLLGNAAPTEEAPTGPQVDAAQTRNGTGDAGRDGLLAM